MSYFWYMFRHFCKWHKSLYIYYYIYITCFLYLSLTVYTCDLLNIYRVYSRKQGMGVIFQKKGKEKFGQKCTFEKILKKDRWLNAIITRNKLLEYTDKILWAKKIIDQETLLWHNHISLALNFMFQGLPFFQETHFFFLKKHIFILTSK